MAYHGFQSLDKVFRDSLLAELLAFGNMRIRVCGGYKDGDEVDLLRRHAFHTVQGSVGELDALRNPKRLGAALWPHVETIRVRKISIFGNGSETR